VADEKGLDVSIDLDPRLPQAIVTDEQRLQQILRNLLSNAFKFTESGSVTLRVEPGPEDVAELGEPLQTADGIVALSVTDTGVGIPKDKLALIFEAFQQADGTTSRKYGGTGLGLSISREIARLLGGEIHAASTPGIGSTFTLYLPLVSRPADGRAEVVLEPTPAVSDGGALAPETLLPFESVDDDRATVIAGDRALLVIAPAKEVAADALATARARGFKGLVARRAPIGLALAREYRPDAVLVFTTGARGDVLLGQLKQHPETRHRPVFLVGPPGARLEALREGAAAYFEETSGGEAVARALDALERFERRTVKRLALVQDGPGLDPATLTLLSAGDDVEVWTLSPADAIAELEAEPVECVVVTPAAGGQPPFEILEQAGAVPAFRETPFLVYCPEPLSVPARAHLEARGEAVVGKSGSSPERLVDEAAIFLHRMEARMPAPTRKLLAHLRTADSVFHGKRVLIVDDDIRNVFALASALEVRGMKVLFAENGREGIERLREHPNVDLVLLDVMMPEMDGYETARAIRTMPRFERLPIISLTAKAMKGDRDKSISAGASDYVTKPVDMDQLLSVMRVWLHR